MIPARIVVIGGSTVHGEGDPENGGFVARLKAWHETANPTKHRVFNLGIGGDTVEGMLKRGPGEAKLRRPDLILLYPGLNDGRRKDSPTAPPFTELDFFSRTLEILLAELSRCARTIVMSSVPPDESRTKPFRGGFYFLESDAQALSAAGKSSATLTNTEYLPLFESWEYRPDRRELLADGLHCNAKGHEELFKELIRFLQGRSH